VSVLVFESSELNVFELTLEGVLFLYMTQFQPDGEYGWLFTVNPIDGPIGGFDVHPDLKGQWSKTGKNRIRITEGQCINTSIFEEAIVLEYNGALTKEGAKGFKGFCVPEGELKPIIDFLNR
jgi:hypothetical protein